MDNMSSPVSGSSCLYSINAFEHVFAIANRYSMCGRDRLLNLYCQAVEMALSNPEANFVDCGVAAGGSSAVLASALRACQGGAHRRVFCFDTFKGLPAPGPQDTREGRNAAELGWGEGTCSADQSSLKEVCELLEVGDLIVPVEGLFQDTLPLWRQRVGPVALLHMDGDWYDSTLQILESLYDQVLPRGIIQIDDYGYWDGCREAVSFFFEERGLGFKPHVIDSTGVWLRKSEVVSIRRPIHDEGVERLGH